MNYPILIPSRGRTHLFQQEACTIQQFDEELRKRTFYFVEPSDYAAYLPHSNRLGFNVIQVETTCMGDLRKQMAEFAKERGFDIHYQFDDDLKWFRRDTGTKLVACDPIDIKNMMYDMELLTDGFAVVGVSAREGNNRHEGVAYNNRIIRAFLFDTEKFLQMEHARVTYMEDFDVLLQLLEAGYENAVLFDYAQDQRGTQAKGGCSIHRTQERHDASARRLKELHPDVVALRQKNNKTGGEFGQRTEVTIQWKRALRQL